MVKDFPGRGFIEIGVLDCRREPDVAGSKVAFEGGNDELTGG